MERWHCVSSDFDREALLRAYEELKDEAFQVGLRKRYEFAPFAINSLFVVDDKGNVDQAKTKELRAEVFYKAFCVGSIVYAGKMHSRKFDEESGTLSYSSRDSPLQVFEPGYGQRLFEPVVGTA